MGRIVPFADIGLLKPMDVVTFESRYGTISGYVADVVPGESVSIFTGGTQPTTRLDSDAFKVGMLTVPDLGEAKK